jgi:hypothetical protein
MLTTHMSLGASTRVEIKIIIIGSQNTSAKRPPIKKWTCSISFVPRALPTKTPDTWDSYKYVVAGSEYHS